jgi:hypothetical protein
MSVRAIPAGEPTVFGEKIVRAANNELGDQLAELLQFLLALGFHFIGRVCVATTNDNVLKVLPKIVFRSQEIGICEIEQGKVLRKIVLRVDYFQF